MIRESNDSELEFKEFVVACTQTANRLEQISFNEQRFKGRGTAKNQTITTTTATTAATIPKGSSTTTANQGATSNAATSSTNRLSKEARYQLMKEGRCFICKQTGHIAPSCPFKTTPTTTTELKNLEKLVEEQTVEETEQGNEET